MAERSLVLPQLNVPGFVDSPREALLYLRNGWGLGGGRLGGEGMGNYDWFIK